MREIFRLFSIISLRTHAVWATAKALNGGGTVRTRSRFGRDPSSVVRVAGAHKVYFRREWIRRLHGFSFDMRPHSFSYVRTFFLIVGCSEHGPDNRRHQRHAESVFTLSDYKLCCTSLPPGSSRQHHARARAVLWLVASMVACDPSPHHTTTSTAAACCLRSYHTPQQCTVSVIQTTHSNNSRAECMLTPS